MASVGGFVQRALHYNDDETGIVMMGGHEAESAGHLPRHGKRDPWVLETVPHADGGLMPLPDDLALRLGVADLVAAYGDCIDDDRSRDGLDFFVDDCWLPCWPGRESHDEGCATASSITTRLARDAERPRLVAAPRQHLRKAPPYRHVTGAPRVLSAADGVATRRGRTSSARASCTMARPACSPPAATSTASMSPGTPFQHYRAPRRARQPEARSTRFW